MPPPPCSWWRAGSPVCWKIKGDVLFEKIYWQTPFAAAPRTAGCHLAITELYGDKGAVAQEIIDAKRAELGLDQPFLVQYGAWLRGLLTGDMGVSYVSGKNVFDTFVSKLPATLLLTCLSIVATVVISIPLGIWAAVRQDRFVDYFLRFFSFIGNSLPNFFVALLLMQLFSIKWKGG